MIGRLFVLFLVWHSSLQGRRLIELLVGKMRTAELGESIVPERGINGYIKVNKDGDDLFYWLFPSKSNSPNAPLVFWLQGGPGSSSFLGLLRGNGPFSVVDGEAVVNENSWNEKYDMMYVDNPIGTGFSHAKVDNMIKTPAELQDMAETFILEFLQLHPQYKGRDLYVTGESYAGHHIPYYSSRYFEMMKTNKDINLKGVAIGNGWVHASQIYQSYSDFMLREKIINQTYYDQLQPMTKSCSKLMQAYPPLLGYLSTDYCNELYELLITDPATGEVRFSDYDIRLKENDSDEDLAEWLAKPEVVNMLEADKQNTMFNDEVYWEFTWGDWQRDASPYLKPLLEGGLKVMAYNGNKDYICNYVSGYYWTEGLKWKSQQSFIDAVEKPADFGTVKQFDNFALVIVPDAGHMVPHDQPGKAKAMIEWFIDDFKPIP